MFRALLTGPSPAGKTTQPPYANLPMPATTADPRVTMQRIVEPEGVIRETTMRSHTVRPRSSCLSRLAVLGLALLVGGSVVILLVRITLRAVEGVRATAPEATTVVAPSPESTAYPLSSAGWGANRQPGVTPIFGLTNNRIAPDFSLGDLNGDLVSLSSLKGRFVILNFWATWCGPCRIEMPDLDQLYREHAAHGLTVLAVNMTQTDSVQAVEAFVDELDLSFPVLLDTTGEVSNQRYGVLGLPTTYFVDREGTIMRMQLGPLNRSELDALITEAGF